MHDHNAELIAKIDYTAIHRGVHEAFAVGFDAPQYSDYGWSVTSYSDRDLIEITCYGGDLVANHRLLWAQFVMATSRGALVVSLLDGLKRKTEAAQ